MQEAPPLASSDRWLHVGAAQALVSMTVWLLRRHGIPAHHSTATAQHSRRAEAPPADPCRSCDTSRRLLSSQRLHHASSLFRPAPVAAAAGRAGGLAAPPASAAAGHQRPGRPLASVVARDLLAVWCIRAH
eukprot:4930241-Pleurochrysis_carterae.AAC.4